MLRRHLTHTVTVAPYRGNTGNGPSYGPPFTLRCRVTAAETASADRSTTSPVTIMWDRYADDMPLESVVTVAGYGDLRLVAVDRLDAMSGRTRGWRGRLA